MLIRPALLTSSLLEPASCAGDMCQNVILGGIPNGKETRLEKACEKGTGQEGSTQESGVLQEGGPEEESACEEGREKGGL
ncbi:MAG: hypothetical protein ABSH44_13185 [Bryobacteraceae bacterium]|jgi:hypothetical protein